MSVHVRIWPVGMLAVLLLAGCVGIVDDYAKTALGFTEHASANTVRNLEAKHDLEAAMFAALYCRQMRVGAERRRYHDPTVLMRRLELCEEEEMIGFQR